MLPQLKTLPSVVTASVWSPPKEDWSIFSPTFKLKLAVISTGIKLFPPNELIPNCPWKLLPHINNLPSEVIADEWLVPKLIEIIFSWASKAKLLVISTGDNFLFVVLSPNSPFELNPHVNTLPCEVKTPAWLPLAEIIIISSAGNKKNCAVISLGNRTSLLYVPSPIWPDKLSPHVNTLPLEVKAIEK